MGPSLAPTHPGGTQQVAPSSSSDVGPCDAQRLARAAARASAPAARPPCARRRARSRARGRRSRSAPRARGGTRSARSGLQRHRQLERLARVAQVGLALARQLAGLARAGTRYERTRSRRSSLATSPSADSTPAASGTSTVRISSSSASAHACSGPAPPNATSAKSRGSWPALDRDDAQRAQHLGVDDRDDLRRDRCSPSARSAAARSSSMPAGEPRRQAAEQEVRVGDRRPRAAAPVAGRARDRRPRSPARRAARRPRRARRSSRRRRRPCGCRPSAAGSGSRRRRARTCAPPRRPTIRQTSVDVPPMSNAIAFSIARLARDARRADDARGRTGDERERGMRRRLVELRDAARRAHDERRGQPGARRSARRARAGSARHDRPEVRVDRRRRRALVLAELRRDLVRRDDVRVRQAAPHLGGDRALVRRVAVRVEQADRDRLGVELRQRVEVERLELAVRARSARARRSSARAARAAPDAPRTAGRGARGSAAAGGAGARSRRSSTNAVRAPLRSSSAFVATVVPCVKRSTRSAPDGARRRDAPTPPAARPSAPSPCGSRRRGRRRHR